MGKLKFTVHPLFILFGIYFAVIGKVFSFLTYTLVAVIHELGHSLVAEALGYKLQKITLMPYGALVSGEQSLFSFSDEIKIAFAGPIVNLATAVLFVALWWLKPEIYPYTDTAVFASLSIATINLLPCYPLDGGRILLAVLSTVIKRKKALKIVKASGITLSVALIILFVYSIFVSVNPSILFFALFVLFGNVFVSTKCDYIRLFSGLDMRAVEKGRAIKKVAVSETTKVKTLYKFIDSSTLTELVVLSTDGKTKNALSFDKTFTLVSLGKPYLTVGDEVRRLRLTL